MRRFPLRYTRALLLPLLAVGLALAGCDSTGPNGDEDESPFEYPSDSYETQTAVNLLAFDLGVRVGNAADNSESALLDRYTGNISDVTIRASQGLTTEGQNVYGDLDGDVNLSSLVSTDNLVRSSELESTDSPSAGSPVTTDQLLRYYFSKAGTDNVTATENGFVLSQFAEKMILGTPLYGEGTQVLNDFVNGNISSDEDDRLDAWDAAFGYFGFPRSLEPFIDYSGGEEGLASGAAQDIDGNGVDLTSEYVHTWASYAIERSAAAENNGQPNDFARDAFQAFVQGREDIENGEDPSDHAETILRAWEATVAVNVIHYINSMESSLENTSGTVSKGDISEDAWGEAKAFAWGLQFYSDNLTETQLQTIHDAIGNDPPYGEMTASDYATDLGNATQILQEAYGFNASNVEAW